MSKRHPGKKAALEALRDQAIARKIVYRDHKDTMTPVEVASN